VVEQALLDPDDHRVGADGARRSCRRSPAPVVVDDRLVDDRRAAVPLACALRVDRVRRVPCANRRTVGQARGDGDSLGPAAPARRGGSRSRGARGDPRVGAVEGAAERERAHRSLAALAALKLAESRALALQAGGRSYAEIERRPAGPAPTSTSSYYTAVAILPLEVPAGGSPGAAAPRSAPAPPRTRTAWRSRHF
jgi:hypothetical protein